MYSINNEKDKIKILKYHRAKDMVNIMKYFPGLSPVDDLVVILDENDYLLLCSDGLSNKISETEMVSIIQKDIPLEEKGKLLVALANEHGGEDNITLILLHFNPRSEGGRNIC